jgi:glycosyltransferase involved in cell wall biosynthesis
MQQMSKLLFISNASRGVGSFCLSSLLSAKKNGVDFFYAANFAGSSLDKIKEDEEKYGITIINVPICRSPFSLKNINAYKILNHFINEQKIDYIHCNTPVGGLLGRLLGKNKNIKKVIYEVHGFHFYKGASLKKWFVYYPVEKWLAKKTDVLITINKEDYELANKKFCLRNNGKIVFIPGVGIDLSNYESNAFDRKAKRNEFGFDENDIVLISMGDLIKRKNYKVSIDAIAKVRSNNIHLLICGDGPEKMSLQKLINKKKLENKVKLLGYRNDVKQLLNASDIYLFVKVEVMANMETLRLDLNQILVRVTNLSMLLLVELFLKNLLILLTKD